MTGKQSAIAIAALLSGCGPSPQQRALPAPAAVPPPAERAPQAQAPAQLVVAPLPDGQPGSGTEADPFRSLQVAIDSAPDGAVVIVKSGVHRATPVAFIDQTCGNCSDEEFRSQMPATYGFRITGKSLTLRGESREGSVLHTGAGYGLLIEDAGAVTIDNLTITGGRRDADGRATDGAVVVRNSQVVLESADLVGNNHLFEGDPDPVVGIAGLVLREGAVVAVSNCRIQNNSWDGIAAYRGDPAQPGTGPVLAVDNTLIACTDRCIKRAGRGVGIGVTWDARASIRAVDVRGYWKGIGSFGTAHVIVANSVIRDQYGWGVVVSGESTMEVINNVIAHNGTVGLAAWNEAVSGRFVNNVIIDNGWNEREWVGKRTGLWLNKPDFPVRHNAFWNNRLHDVCRGGTPEEEPCAPLPIAIAEGNRVVDPHLPDGSFRPVAPSPLIDAGDTEIRDADGSASDIGAWGGPAPQRNVPAERPPLAKELDDERSVGGPQDDRETPAKHD